MNDHDVLIRLDQKTTDIWGKIKADSELNIKAHSSILERIDNQQNILIMQSHKFVSSKLFYWLLGFVIIGLVGIGAGIAENSSEISKVDSKIEMQMRTPNIIHVPIGD